MVVQGGALRRAYLMPPRFKMRNRVGGSKLMRALLCVLSYLYAFVLCRVECHVDKIINWLAEFPCVQVADAEPSPTLITRNGTSAVCFNGPTDRRASHLLIAFAACTSSAERHVDFGWLAVSTIALRAWSSKGAILTSWRVNEVIELFCFSGLGAFVGAGCLRALFVCASFGQHC
jgi:hypothetical protein